MLELNGHRVPIVLVPDLPWLGNTKWTPAFTGHAGPPIEIQLREHDLLGGRVLLHEVLHVLLGTDPQRVLPVEDSRHEDFVRMLTTGLFDQAGCRLTR